MKNEIFVYWGIWDFDVTHDELTQIMGIAPKTKRDKGELLPYTSTPTHANENCWIFESPFSKNNAFAPFEEHLDAILSILEEKVDKLAPICANAKTNSELSFIIYVYPGENSTTPGLHFDKRYNTLANQLNMDLDIDVIYLKEDDEG